MIFRRWSHGHNIGTGVLGGLLLSNHAWTVAALAFSLGLAVGVFGRWLRAGGEAVVRRFTSRPARRLVQTPDGPRLVPGMDERNLRAITYPTGIPGVRVDAQGREWYSAAWLDGAA